MVTIRWHQRFENFIGALLSLEETAVLMTERPLSELEKAGAVQQFEVCWEAGWKSMRDYLHAAGNHVEVATAINVIRSAFEINLISNGDAWVDAMKARNIMSHEYDCEAFGRTVEKIRTDYLPLLQALRSRLQAERDAGN